MISAEKYKVIADLLNNAQDRGSDILGYLTSMTTDLSNSEISEDSIHRQRLEDQIDATSDVVQSRHVNYTTYMLDFVRTLQKYIDDRYSSIDDFLSDNNTQVLPVFAEMSESVGYPISAANIENVS